jgi:glutathione S-transferase
LLLSQLDVPFERIDYDIDRHETRTPEFLAKNPNGRIPLLEIGPGQFLAESNAILLYLGEGTPFVPTERLERARMMQWLFFEQYSHEPNIATLRFWITHKIPRTPFMEAAMPVKREQGHAALGVMETHLKGRDWFAGQSYSIADIALYAYTHVAGEGGFDLAPYPQTRRWLERVADRPGHVAITDFAIGRRVAT